MWQDFVFLAGSVFSIVVLVPTLRDSMANVPLGTSLPSAVIGLVYGTTFVTLDMTLSGVGALLTGVIWSLIAFFRSPNPLDGSDSQPSAGRDAGHSSPVHAD